VGEIPQFGTPKVQGRVTDTPSETLRYKGPRRRALWKVTAEK